MEKTNDIPKPPAPTEAAGGPAAEGRTPPQGRDQLPREIGGPTGPEPTRYGDWERNGRCSDF
jgi:hypothetical protein